ncbi:MAG: CoA transferase [Thermoflexus sp.]|nr:CoA transferase [Thermoflexus sp.]
MGRPGRCSLGSGCWIWPVCRRGPSPPSGTFGQGTGSGRCRWWWRASGPGFAAVRRGNKSVALQLKHCKGWEIFLRFVESGDVVVEAWWRGPDQG